MQTSKRLRGVVDRVGVLGDLLSLDLAVNLGGVVADSAVSFVVGESEPAESLAMIAATENFHSKRNAR